jgi:MHS family citrate/tricarballylate:H+ symporter-like MFS transporter
VPNLPSAAHVAGWDHQPAGTHPSVTKAPTDLEPRTLKRHLAAAVVGNALEFYDFTTFALFADHIGHTFFPSKDPFVSLMASLATFGIGFATRPIGGIVIGLYSDRVGRKPAMVLSFTLMGLAIIGMALIPSYAAIGIAAPVLAVLARTVQGFALGGEVGPTTAFLLEAAPLHRRGLYTAWQSASQSVASLAGAGVGLGLSMLLSAAMLDEWGWRIAFLIGGLTVPVGLAIRRSLPETLHHDEVLPTHVPLSEDVSYIAQHGRMLLLGLLMLSNGTISTYVLLYLTTYARTSLHLGAIESFGATVLSSAVGVFAALYAGFLSDRYGRKPISLYPRIALFFCAFPVFWFMAHAQSILSLLFGSALLGFLINMGPFHVWLIESMPKAVRGTTFATLYAVTISVFGGTTQPIITWLIHAFKNPIAPGWYLMGSTLVGCIAIALFREAAPVIVHGPAPILDTGPR